MLTVRNGGTQPVKLSQVVVNDAIWDFEAEPDRTIPRLGSATVTIPYSWVEGEAYEIVLITSTGTTFDAEVPVAVLTPQFSGETFWSYALIGTYVGVIPVALGLLWYPFLRRLGSAGMNFVLAMTVGLLAFLVIDTLEEAMEVAAELPGVFSGVPLVVLLTLLTLLGLVGMERLLRRGSRGGEPARHLLPDSPRDRAAQPGGGAGHRGGVRPRGGGPGSVPGRGLHAAQHHRGGRHRRANPEGEAAAGALPVAGAARRGPAIVGTWIGGFAFSNLLAAIFLAVGAGAILQVIYEVTRLLLKDSGRSKRPCPLRPRAPHRRSRHERHTPVGGGVEGEESFRRRGPQGGQVVEAVLPGETVTARAAHASLKGHRKGLARLWPFLGPAFIAAVAYVDPGNFATNIAGGAQLRVHAPVGDPDREPHGDAHPVDVGQAGDRHGQEPPEVCRERFPRPVTLGLWVQAEVIAMATDLAEFIGAALALNLLSASRSSRLGLMTAVGAFGILELQRRGFRPWRRRSPPWSG